jgi:tRNA (cmo5U34)-methyltransferase
VKVLMFFMKKDTIYSEKKDNIPPFEFNEDVAQVFDDMLQRSVPLYRETVQRQAQMTVKYYQKGTRIYDLGCSNGNYGMQLLFEMRGREFEMIAVDNSESMLLAYKKRLEDKIKNKNIKLECKNIQDVKIKNASVVIINLTLQFLPIELRERLIKNIHGSLLPNGVLLITEKIIHKEKEFAALHQEFYCRFKKENGYSDLEISQKRDALENILISETIEDHLRRFKDAGFKKIDVWQKWFNFAAFICRK